MPEETEATTGVLEAVRSWDDQREVVLQLGATGRTSSSSGKKVSDGADLAKAVAEPLFEGWKSKKGRNLDYWRREIPFLLSGALPQRQLLLQRPAVVV